MIFIQYFTQFRKHQLHNPKINETIILKCKYIGFSSADLFTGIKSIEKLDGSKINPNQRPLSLFSQSLSNLCILLPIVTLISTITGVVTLIYYFQVNIIIALVALCVAFVINLVIYIVSLILESFFVYTLPERSGWLKAYINDDGTVTTPDKRNRKTIPLTISVGGKTSTQMMDQKESDKTYDAFFGKEGIFEKYKK